MTELPDRLLREALHDTASKTPSTGCVDADTLAAWADGTLTSAARAAFEAHAAACTRCQALVAAMVRTEPPPIESAWWRRSPFAWLLPLATVTAAAVIVVDLALVERRSSPSETGVRSVPAPAASEAAPVGSEPAPATRQSPAPPSPTPPAVSAAAGNQASREQAARKEVPGEPATREQDTARERPSGPPASAPVAAHRDRSPIDKTEPQTATSQAQPEAVAPVAKPSSPAGAAASVPLPKDAAVSQPAPAMTPQPAPPPAQPPARPTTPPTAPSPASPPAQPPAQAAAAGVTSSPALRDEVARPDSAVAGARAMLKAAAPAPVVIPSPDRDSKWRIVAGAVEHSADQGQTWQLQPLGVAGPVRAGSAPAARVCWLVGAGGLVLLTTDGGATWTRMAFPEPADLVAVQASSASHATVTTATGGRFDTSDRGKSWIKQEPHK